MERDKEMGNKDLSIGSHPFEHRQQAGFLPLRSLGEPN